MTVYRDHDQGVNKSIKDERFSFQPGESSPENRQDESHGVNTTVTCENDRITVGETTTCTVAFKAPATEIPKSYWQINGQSVGAWPSQIAR